MCPETIYWSDESSDTEFTLQPRDEAFRLLLALAAVWR